MKKIHVHEEKHDGKALRQLRNALHVGPYEVAQVANLTRVQLGELERGDWGNWNNLTRQEALDRYLDALARIERIQKEPPAPKPKPSNRGAEKVMSILMGGLAFADPRPLPQSKLKRW